MVVLDIRDRVAFPVGWPSHHLRCRCPRVLALQRLLHPSRHGRPLKRRVHHPAKRRGRNGRVRGARIFFGRGFAHYGGLKKGWRTDFFWCSELRNDFFDHVFQGEVCEMMTLWGKRHRTSPLLGKTKAPTGLESDDSSEATKRAVFVLKKWRVQKGKPRFFKAFGVVKPPKFGQEVGWIMKKGKKLTNNTPFFPKDVYSFQSFIRSPPSNKKLWDKKHQTPISYIVCILYTWNPFVVDFWAWTIPDKVLSHQNKSNQRVIIQHTARYMK